jgi:hypothetical protein
MSWLTGVAEGLLFRSFMRKSFPHIADEYFPGFLKTSISQQRKTRAWLKNRKYADQGDYGLTKRADLHRKIRRVSLWMMVAAFIALILFSVTYNVDSSNKSSQTSVENQAMYP